MTKKTEVIKNPGRKLNQMLNKRDSYQPEYVRLGIDPPKAANVPQADFEYAFNKRKPFVTSSGGKKDVQVDEHPTRVAVRRPKVMVEAEKPRGDYRPATMVSSGFNHEHTWHPVAKYFDEETVPEDQINEEDYPWQDNKNDEELEQEERAVSSGKIGFDEISDEDGFVSKPNKIHMTPGPVAENKKAEKPLKPLERVPTEGYCIAVDGKIAHISETLEDIEAMLEYILFDQDSPLGDVSIESISVFKRLSIRAGVVVKE